ncbi:MAG: hypothetical protein HY698_21830 [Deltaproteobacteria bacterium]|nr:hypothetical protein [Deltaproteobacteria bacterium]
MTRGWLWPLAVCLAVCLTGACHKSPPRGRLMGSLYRRGEVNFHVGVPGPSWKRIEARGGDLAWFEPRATAIMSVTATCHGHKDPPLEVLRSDLLLGTRDRRYLLEERIVLDSRDALHSVVMVTLDGVPMVYDLYVLKKDGCVYDLSLVSPPESYDLVADEFQHFVGDFHAGGSWASSAD